MAAAKQFSGSALQPTARTSGRGTCRGRYQAAASQISRGSIRKGGRYIMAGYGIKGYLVCQDINQLKSPKTRYGQDGSITSNCHIQNAFPPNRIETAEH